MRSNPAVQGEFAAQIQERRELGAKAEQQIFEARPFFGGNPLFGRMREWTVGLVSRRRNQSGRFANNALGKASSGAGRAQQADFEKRGTPGNGVAGEPQPQQRMCQERST